MFSISAAVAPGCLITTRSAFCPSIDPMVAAGRNAPLRWQWMASTGVNRPPPATRFHADHRSRAIPRRCRWDPARPAAAPAATDIIASHAPASAARPAAASPGGDHGRTCNPARLRILPRAPRLQRWSTGHVAFKHRQRGCHRDVARHQQPDQCRGGSVRIHIPDRVFMLSPGHSSALP